MPFHRDRSMPWLAKLRSLNAQSSIKIFIARPNALARATQLKRQAFCIQFPASGAYAHVPGLTGKMQRKNFTAGVQNTLVQPHICTTLIARDYNQQRKPIIAYGFAGPIEKELLLLPPYNPSFLRHQPIEKAQTVLGELSGVYVDAAYHGQGVGTRMTLALAYALQNFGCQHITTYCLSGYQSNDFVRRLANPLKIASRLRAKPIDGNDDYFGARLFYDYYVWYDLPKMTEYLQQKIQGQNPEPYPHITPSAYLLLAEAAKKRASPPNSGGR